MLKIKDCIFIFIYLMFAIMGMALIKMGASEKEAKVLFEISRLKISSILILGVICYGISFILYIFVISQMQISLALPIAAAINSISSVIIGVLIFNEVINYGQTMGIVVVILGVFIIGIFSK